MHLGAFSFFIANAPEEPSEAYKESIKMAQKANDDITRAGTDVLTSYTQNAIRGRQRRFWVSLYEQTGSRFKWHSGPLRAK